ncbi:MAG: hypothetical protein ACLRHD_00755 [Thomasclavelia spiroformis]
MIIAFFSNYLSHHQLPFSEEMNKIRDCEYYFISCEPFNDERIKLGWKSENKKIMSCVHTNHKKTILKQRN